MPVTIALDVPIAATTPAEAIAAAIALLSSARLDGAARVELRLVATSHPGVLRALAERLPPAARGFQNGPSKAQRASAGEFLEARGEKDRGLCFYRGELTAHMGAAEAIALVQALAAGPAAAVRSTGFSLAVSGVAWPGASDATGAVQLEDRKGRGRAKRYALGTELVLPGQALDAPELLAALAALEATTGLAWTRGQRRSAPAAVPGPPPSAPAPNARLPVAVEAEARYQEALEHFGASVRERAPTLPAWPHLVAASGLVQARVEASRRGRGGSIDLATAVKATLGRLPGFMFVGKHDVALRYQRSVTPEVAMLVEIVRQGSWTLGRSFTPRLGVALTGGPAAGLVRVDPLFRLWHLGTEPAAGFVYATRDELREALVAFCQWLVAELPGIDTALMTWLAPGAALPLADHDDPTARQALALAGPDAGRLVGLAGATALPLRGEQSPALTAAGGMRPHGLWRARFLQADGTTATWELPGVGSPRMTLTRDIGRQVPLDDGWMDSNAALAHAAAALTAAGLALPAADAVPTQARLESAVSPMDTLRAVSQASALRALARALPGADDEDRPRGPATANPRWVLRFGSVADRRELHVSFDAIGGGGRVVEVKVGGLVERRELDPA